MDFRQFFRQYLRCLAGAVCLPQQQVLTRDILPITAKHTPHTARFCRNGKPVTANQCTNLGYPLLFQMKAFEDALCLYSACGFVPVEVICPLCVCCFGIRFCNVMQQCRPAEISGSRHCLHDPKCVFPYGIAVPGVMLFACPELPAFRQNYIPHRCEITE